MKRIFYFLFLFLFGIGFVFPSQKVYSAEKFENPPIVSAASDDLVDSMKDQNYFPEAAFFSVPDAEQTGPWEAFKNKHKERWEMARNRTSAEVSLIDHPENIDAYTFLLMGTKDGGILTGAKGLGPVHHFEFADASLVACYGNLDEQKYLTAALLVKLNPYWVLKKPVIPPSFSERWTEELVFYPETASKEATRTDSYEDMVLFPLIYRLTESQAPFDLSKEITLTACLAGNACVTETALYTLHIDPGKGYRTDVCPAIMQAINRSAVPLPESVSVSLHQNANRVMQLAVVYPEKVSAFRLLIENVPTFKVLTQSIRENKVMVTFRVPEEVDLAQALDLRLLSPFGWFQAQIVPDTQVFQPERPDLSAGQIILSGLLFFVFSAFYLLFWSVRPVSQKELTDCVRFVVLNALCFALICWGVLYCRIPVVSFLQGTPVLFFQLGLLLFLLVRPTISIKMVPILLICMPYPFLHEIFLTFSGSALGAVLIAGWWGFCGCLPFMVFSRLPQLFVAFEKADKPLWKIQRLPVAIMSVWVGVLLVSNTIKQPDVLTETALLRAMQSGQVVVVSVENGSCPECRLNERKGRFSQMAYDLSQSGKLVFFKLDQDSELGRKLLNKYALAPSRSFYLIFSPDLPDGMFREGRYFMPEDWDEFLPQIDIPHSEESESDADEEESDNESPAKSVIEL